MLNYTYVVNSIQYLFVATIRDAIVIEMINIDNTYFYTAIKFRGRRL